jgi:hypothetical protein
MWQVIMHVPPAGKFLGLFLQEATPIKVLWAASAGADVKLREVLSQ